MITRKQIKVAHRNVNLQNHDYQQADQRLINCQGGVPSKCLCNNAPLLVNKATTQSVDPVIQGKEQLIPPKEFKIFQIFMLPTSHEKLTG